MNLTSEEIQKNYNTFVELGTVKYNVFDDKLLNILGKDLITAPSSTKLDLYNAFPGGMIDHTLKTIKWAFILNKRLGELKLNEDSLIKVTLLYQIGKVNMYVMHISDWHRKKGIMYDYKDNDVSMRVSDRSLYYIAKSGIDLTEEEYMAICNYDKVNDNMAEFHNTPLGDLLMAANKMAILEIKLNGSKD